jgi:crotonobetainyl-CoA:carnitine CoA-transferase CaiB-like acyl-CoA transferase
LVRATGQTLGVRGPLDSIRIIDLTTVFSGPYGSVLLADLGADVIKIEPPGGDVVRRIGPTPAQGMGPLFMAVGRNKRDVCLDLKVPAGQEVLRRLVDGADVLIHNMRPSAARRIGADPETCRGRNPRLIHCAVVGFGDGGPYADLPAYDDVVQAASGLVALQSHYSEGLEYVRTVVADKVAGLFAFGAVSAALFQRQRTGEGCAVEVPMFEAFTSFVLLEHLYGRTFDPPTGEAGYARVMAADRRPFRTSDGWISVVFYNDRQWRAFFETIGRPELADDARFAEHGARTAHSDLLYAMVAEAMSMRTTSTWMALLRELDVPAMPVSTVDDILADPHLAAVGMFDRRDHHATNRYVRVRNPLVFSTGIGDGRSEPPLLGEHTEEVLREAGYTDAEVRDLLARGVALGVDEPHGAPGEEAGDPGPVIGQ